jgi:mRNA interferase RelE/StbE
MALRVIFLARATKEYLDLPRQDRDRIRERVTDYAADPAHARHDVRRLVGQGGRMRLRSGKWRVVFEVTGDTMTVQRVLHRREAYR